MKNIYKPSPPAHPTSTQDCLQELLKTNKMSDITFLFTSNPTHVIKTHRLILAAWSPIFKAMLYGTMIEEDTITLPDDPPMAFGDLIKFLYTGNLHLKDVSSVSKVYKLARKYQIDPMETKCSNKLLELATPDSVPGIINIACSLNNTALLNRCAYLSLASSDEVL